MEPVHIYALLQQRDDTEARWREIEQRLAVRASVRRQRLERIRRVRRLLVPRPRAVPTARPAI